MFTFYTYTYFLLYICVCVYVCLRVRVRVCACFCISVYLWIKLNIRRKSEKFLFEHISSMNRHYQKKIISTWTRLNVVHVKTAKSFTLNIPPEKFCRKFYICIFIEINFRVEVNDFSSSFLKLFLQLCLHCTRPKSNSR